MNMRKLVCSAVFAAAASAQAALDCPHWISVMPMRDGCAEELAADAADLGNTTFIDGIVWSCSVMPSGDPPDDKGAMFVKRWQRISPLVRDKSRVRQGILLQSTMGHISFPGTPTPWQLTVKPDGKSVYRMCPMDERFLAYIAKTCREFSDARPDFFMVDDDTRMVWDDVPGCFCPLHLAEFAKRTGRPWTREDVMKMLSGSPCEHSRIWEDVKVDSLRRFFRTIRENFSPDIPGMLCTVSSPHHIKHVREFAQILAAPGQKPVVRGSGAPYHGKDMFHVIDMRSSYAKQMHDAGDGIVYMQESDTCPHTLWATSAVRNFDHLVMLALEGCKGAKIWVTRGGNYHEKKSGEAYRRTFRENRGLMEWAAKTDFRQKGVVIPFCGPPISNFGDRYFALTGIPYRFGKAEKGEITAVTAATLKCLKPEEIREILSGAVLADGPAALWLSKNGYSGDIGVSAKPWKRRTIQQHELMDGFRQLGLSTGDLTDLSETAPGAKVLTRLYNVPKLDATPEFEAPGSVLFENARGGKVLSMAQCAPAQKNLSYYAASLMSETYREEMVKWLRVLGGGVPGGARYLGVGPVTCESGTTEADGNVFVLNVLDLDDDDAPEMEFDEDPVSIERLGGDGVWRRVGFVKTGKGRVRMSSQVRTQRPAIFRWRKAEICRETLIAHRGHVAVSTTSAQPPENTLASLDESVAEGIGFECDVMYTKDNRVFTMHDGCFKRVYGIDNEDAKSMTWDYVSHLVPIDRSGRRHPETRAALFEEVCERARDGRWCYVEVKTGAEIVPLIKKVLEGQNNANPRNLKFISFHPDAIRALKRELPEYKAMLLMFSRHSAPRDVKYEDRKPYTAEECLKALAECGADGLDIRFDRSIPEQGPEFVSKIKSAGYEFHVWVVDDLPGVRQAFANGAQTVTTNKAKTLLEEAGVK